MAGGSLLDVGVYCLHFADLVLGRKPETVFASARISGGIDLSSDMLLTYPSGATARLSSAMDHSKQSSGYIYGNLGYIFLPNFYKAREFYICKNGEERCVKMAPIGDGFEEEIIEVCRCINEGRIESETLSTSVTVEMMELMDAVRKQIGVVYPFEKM
jgi:predicted dehydrogenase